MPEEVKTIVKIPISEIEESVRAKHVLPKILTEAKIEGDSLILSFEEEQVIEHMASNSIARGLTKKRRSRKKRNRMKTRGWEVVARIINSKGQKCSIYKPFVEALKNPRLTSEEQKRVVEQILRSNRNRPTKESVQYFLENTLEYLQKNSGDVESSNVGNSEE
jgi:hypothetical protein